MKQLSTLIITSLILTFSLTSATIRPQIMGGYTTASLDKCQTTFSNMKPNLEAGGHVFSQMKIVSCSTQVVAGMNYAFELEDAKGETCSMVVWAKLDRTYHPNMEESSCLKKQVESDGSKQLNSNSDKGSQIYRISWMILGMVTLLFTLY